MDIRESKFKTTSRPKFFLSVVLILVMLLLSLNFRFEMRQHIIQLIFLDLIAFLLLVSTVYLVRRLIFYEISIDEEGICQKLTPRKTVKLKWTQVDKVAFDGDFINLCSKNDKIHIFIRTKNLETLLIYIQNYLDENLTKDAFYLLQCRTFIVLDEIDQSKNS